MKFFTSDTHYNHKNICSATSSWSTPQSCRDFGSLEQMNAHIVDQINAIVGPNDELFHLGDWSFGGEKSIKQFYERLVCKNIYLCFGNHDHHIKKKREYQNLFIKTRDTLTTRIQKHSVFMSHYAHRVWDRSHHGVIHLYGHSHGSIPSYGKSIDVGIDSAKLILGEYRPFHEDEIIKIMSKRKIEFPDHHTPQTT